MNTYSKGILSLLAFVALVLGIWRLATPASVSPSASYPAERSNSAPAAGAVASPDIPSPWIRYGGVTTNRNRQSMQSATTTMCWVANPYSATSTLRSFVWQNTVGTSTAAIFSLATSTGRYATSSTDRIIDRDISLASGVQGTFTFDPAPNDNIIAPGEFVLLMTGTPGLGGYTFTGNCQAEFERIQ